MKQKNYSPYANLSINKINAPRNTAKDDPKATKTKGKGDLRVKGSK